MDKADDSVRSIGEVRDRRERIEAHGVHLIAILPPTQHQQHIHIHNEPFTKTSRFHSLPHYAVQYPGQVVHSYVPLLPNSIICYRPNVSDAL